MNMSIMARAKISQHNVANVHGVQEFDTSHVNSARQRQNAGESIQATSDSPEGLKPKQGLGDLL